MKFIILFLISFSAVAGFPPTTLKGQSQSTATTTFNFQVPNNQATKTATGTLVETGSQNLLSNPGFEHSTVGTDWNVTSGTLTASGSAPFGSFSGTFSGSVANGNIQSLTGSGTAQSGLNCLVSAFVKTASSNVQVCAIHNGTLDTNLCVNVNPSNTWAQYQIPTVCDAVSTVARIRITTSVSTTFDVDNVYVGVNPNFGSVAQARLLGTVSITNCSTNWSTTSTTFANFAAQTGCTYTVTGSALAPSTNVPGIRFASLSAGEYKIEYSGYATMSGANPTSYGLRFSDGTNSTRDYTQFLGWGSDGVGFSSQTISYSTQQGDTTIQLQGRTANGGIAAYGTATYPAVIRVYYYPPASSIVTTNNQDYDWTAYTPTFTALGSPTNISFYHKRQGSDLIIMGRFTSATGSASEAQISLPGSLTTSSTVLAAAQSSNVNLVGHAGRSSGLSGEISVIAKQSVSYFNMAISNGSQSALVPANGDALWSTGTQVSLYVRIPIQGWNNNNVIVGTFENSFGTWSSPATITLGGTTTAPTKGTTTQDQVVCRRAGKDWFECDYIYKHTTGGTNGAGDYLFSLPSGYTFDTASRYIPETTVATVNGQTQSAAFELNGAISTTGGDNILQYGIIWDSSRFRLRSSVGITGVGVYNWSNANTNMRFNIKFKGTGPNN